LTDPRISFAKSVDLATAFVEDFPALLFFCGGPINDASSPEPWSVRDAVLRAFTLSHPDLSSRIFLAEDFKDWMHDSVYDELFTFEQHLASLSSAIVIFVESAGSIAELGAFSQLDGVKEKLIIFVPTELYEKDSFIKLGPIKYLEGAFQGSVRTYPWRTVESAHGSRVDVTSLTDCVDEICDAISETLGEVRVQRKFNSAGIRDQMLLVRDVLSQLIGLKLHEIADYILEMGIKIETARLRQYLFVLKTLKLIRSVPRGKDRYYVATDSRRFIRYGMKYGLPKIDRERLQSEVAAYYKNIDGPRFKALAPVLAELEG
jgi:hypothetical protein